MIDGLRSAGVPGSSGCIGLTDPDWYAFLSGCPRVDEVNFWQPLGNRGFRALEPGERFFFKLRAPAEELLASGSFSVLKCCRPGLPGNLSRR